MKTRLKKDDTKKEKREKEEKEGRVRNTVGRKKGGWVVREEKREEWEGKVEVWKRSKEEEEEEKSGRKKGRGREGEAGVVGKMRGKRCITR